MEPTLDEYTTLFEGSFAPEEHGDETKLVMRGGGQSGESRGGGEAIIGDKNIEYWGRENRIALRKGKTRRVRYKEKGAEGFAYYDTPFMCVVHAHPECRFHWARLMIDFTASPDSVIRDMSPAEILGEPVELKTTYKGGVNFETASKVLGANLSAEQSKSHTVYFPRILSSGVGFGKGYWDFLSEGEIYLHTNRELRLLFSAPADQPVQARFRLRAKIKVPGISKLLPMLVREGDIDAIYRLV